jgi:hypothetical protein
VLLVIFKALAVGADYQGDEEPVDGAAFRHLAERLEKAFTAVMNERTRTWPVYVIVTENDLLVLERKPGALWSMEHLDGKRETPIAA